MACRALYGTPVTVLTRILRLAKANAQIMVANFDRAHSRLPEFVRKLLGPRPVDLRNRYLFYSFAFSAACVVLHYSVLKPYDFLIAHPKINIILALIWMASVVYSFDFTMDLLLDLCGMIYRYLKSRYVIRMPISRRRYN